MCRGSVKSTGYSLHPSVSCSLPLPCVTVCHHISTGLYYILVTFRQLHRCGLLGCVCSVCWGVCVPFVGVSVFRLLGCVCSVCWGVCVPFVGVSVFRLLGCVCSVCSNILPLNVSLEFRFQMNYKERISGKQRDCKPGVAITWLGSHIYRYTQTRLIVKGALRFYR
jgi:hypothetical protein